MTRRKEPTEETIEQRVRRVLKEGPRMPHGAWTKKHVEEHCLELCRDLQAFQRYMIDLALDNLENGY